MKIWNLPESGLIKESMKIFILPSIDYNKKIFINYNSKFRITKEIIERELNIKDDNKIM